ncbi:hypothetical protein L3Q82_020754 [Scortum barcoo]|uniref:Uncharacterized protein n=1 Tax=Scortum barcoo TaxID=214431 RepID=A0ACB8VBN0_9TELE|nr:hypothetical protein L3Q82_020754 [Scortum barcoo]
MAHSPSLPGMNRNDGLLELNKDLERIIENIENMSGSTALQIRALSHRVRPPAVQLTWMAYDMAALRTSPELGASVRKLEEAYRRCRAAVCGDREQEEPGRPTDTTLSHM